jgi:bacillithiol system protein YtxJ
MGRGREARKEPGATQVIPIAPSVTSAQAWLDALPADRLVFLFKHSPICGTSALAQEEVERFEAANAATPVYLVDVIDQRPLSQEFAAVLGVGHASPQIVLLRGARPLWNASHWRIRQDAMETEVARAGPSGD